MMKVNKNDEHCAAIAKELAALADGEMVLLNGEPHEISGEYTDDLCAPYYIVDGKNCTFDGLPIEINGEECETETIEECAFYDWFGDSIYDIDYILDGYKEFKACRIMVACGGPNIYINTWDKCVELYWWNESGKAWLPHEVCEYINGYIEEMYYC